MVKGAALFLQQGNSPQGQRSQQHPHKHAGKTRGLPTAASSCGQQWPAVAQGEQSTSFQGQRESGAAAAQRPAQCPRGTLGSSPGTPGVVSTCQCLNPGQQERVEKSLFYLLSYFIVAWEPHPVALGLPCSGIAPSEAQGAVWRPSL